MALEARGLQNNICLKCDKCLPDMVRVGALVFCLDCWKEEFGGELQILFHSPLRAVYSRWYEIYKTKYDL